MLDIGVDFSPGSVGAKPKVHIDDGNRVFLRAINSLSRTMEIRDLYTLGHQQRVSQIARLIGQNLGLASDAIEGLRVGATLHDIGKIGIPAEILSKPAKLNAAEFGLVKTHAEMGYGILREVDFPWPVAEMVYQHHERLDGSGYPRGLKGGEILVEAQIIGVADTIESVAVHRPYRPALGLDRAFEILREGAERLFDPKIVEVGCRVIDSDVVSFISKPPAHTDRSDK